MYSNDFNLILQSRIGILFLSEMSEKGLYTDELLGKMCFSKDVKNDKSFKDFLKSSNGSTQGFAIMALYSMLVIPKELVEKQYKADFQTINDYIENNTLEAIQSTYTNDKKNCLHHIRNAIAHGRIEFKEKEYVIFSDERTNNSTVEHYKVKISLSILIEVIKELSVVIDKYINDELKKMNVK